MIGFAPKLENDGILPGLYGQGCKNCDGDEINLDTSSIMKLSEDTIKKIQKIQKHFHKSEIFPKITNFKSCLYQK